jgi:hypothetical protein
MLIWFDLIWFDLKHCEYLDTTDILWIFLCVFLILSPSTCIRVSVIQFIAKLLDIIRVKKMHMVWISQFTLIAFSSFEFEFGSNCVFTFIVLLCCDSLCLQTWEKHCHGM